MSIQDGGSRVIGRYFMGSMHLNFITVISSYLPPILKLAYAFTDSADTYSKDICHLPKTLSGAYLPCRIL